MKLKEQLDISRRLTRQYREALTYVVLDSEIGILKSEYVKWTIAARVNRFGRDEYLRLGLVKATDPFIIVHDIDHQEVAVVTPMQAADWDWKAVSMFQGLAEFLLNNVDINTAITHSPGNSWLRRVRERMEV